MSESVDLPQKATRFWDRIAKRYSQQPIADEASYQRKLEVTRRYLRPEMEVLEFGCGTGSTALLHAPYVKHLHAIDVSSKMVEIARSKARAEGVENVRFEQATIEGFRAAPESFDVVLGLSILHLLEDKEAVIAKVHRLLKPGGVFVTSTACLADALKYRLFIALVGPIGRLLGLLPMVRVFSRDALEHAIGSAGFVVEHAWQPARDKAVFVVARKPA